MCWGSAYLLGLRNTIRIPGKWKHAFSRFFNKKHIWRSFPFNKLHSKIDTCLRHRCKNLYHSVFIDKEPFFSSCVCSLWHLYWCFNLKKCLEAQNILHIWDFYQAILFRSKNIVVWMKSDRINRLSGECSDFFELVLSHTKLPWSLPYVEVIRTANFFKELGCTCIGISIIQTNL